MTQDELFVVTSTHHEEDERTAESETLECYSGRISQESTNITSIDEQ